MHIARDPTLIADLFDIVTGPAGSYGCEIWSTRFLGDWHVGGDCKPQRYQASVYKHALGVKRSTSNLLTFFEVGKYPMQLQWLSRTMNYWNKLISDKACSELLMCTIAANVHQGITANLPCWSKELLAALVFVAPDHDWKSDMLALKPIAQPKAVLDLARGAFSRSIRAFDQDPTDPNCTTRQRSSYCRWMYRAPAGQLTAPTYLKHNVPVHKKQAVARCRLGGAPIRANTHSSPYTDRICTRCHVGIDNESHMLFDCSHSGLSEARGSHPTLFEGAADVSQFMEAAYNPTLTDSFIHCISAMIGCLESD